MIEHPNALLVHHFLQAARAGDRETLRALWADDIVWVVRGASPWNGEIKGQDAIFEYLADLGEVGSGGFDTDVQDVMVSNEQAAVICQGHAELDGYVLHARYLLLLEVEKRRIQRVTSVPIDADRTADFWAGHDPHAPARN